MTGPQGDGSRHDLTSVNATVPNYVVIPSDDDICRIWAELAAALANTPLKGEGVNDMWIAACALAQNPRPLPVVTGNLADFRKVAAKFPLVIVHPDT